ncbi:ubiquitin-associated protein 1 isoform X2 [Nothobranchius furzeri]|uniref:UBA domain-containing protein n=2 Tax=Nothobranchius furzeri TaxID=105023 RepID=A0A8C6VWP4_NOTFU
MDGVCLKMPQAVALLEVKVTMADYLSILEETEYEFSLENWVLTGLQNDFTNHHTAQLSSSPPRGLLPSCPPYWMLFSSPQQSRLASRHVSDLWEPNPRQRSLSLNAVMRTAFTDSDSDDEGDNTTPVNADLGNAHITISPQHHQRKAQRAFVPNFLNPPSCLSSLPHQNRRNLRQCSFSVMEGTTQSCFPRDTTVKPATSNQNTQSRTHHTPEACTKPPSSSPPMGHASALDSSTELLSALSPKEREILEAITAQGYSLRTAITALQRTGQQTPDQILSYLVACDHLCEQGYDMDQVEEALEMFQNCETKAEEFLHLVNQFNEMGFQLNAIKEVLLVHENHRERALEELMMHVA